MFNQFLTEKAYQAPPLPPKQEHIKPPALITVNNPANREKNIALIKEHLTTIDVKLMFFARVVGLPTNSLKNKIDTLEDTINSLLGGHNLELFTTIEQIIFMLDVITGLLKNIYFTNEEFIGNKQTLIANLRDITKDADLCLPGYLNTLIVIYNNLQANNTITHWLAALRNQIIYSYTAHHCHRLKVATSDETHVLSLFADSANTHGFNVHRLANGGQRSHDIFTSSNYSGVDSGTIKVFLAEFTKAYNPQAIVDCVEVQITSALQQVRDKHFVDEPISSNDKLQPFIDTINPILREISITAHDVLSEHENSYTLNTDGLRPHILQKLISDNIFDFSSLSLENDLLAPCTSQQLFQHLTSLETTQETKLLISTILISSINQLSEIWSVDLNVICNTPTIYQYITPEMLSIRHQNEDDIGLYNGLHRLAMTAEGRVLLTNVLLHQPALAQKIPLSTLDIGPLGSPITNDCACLHLSQHETGIAILQTILMAQKPDPDNLEPMLWPMTSRNHKDKPTPFYYLSHSPLGRELLTKLYELKYITAVNADALCQPVTTNGSTHYALDWLAKEQLGLPIEPQKLATALTDNCLLSRPTTDSPNNLFWLAKQPLLMRQLLLQEPVWAQQISWYDTAKPQTTVDNTSTLFWLCYDSQAKFNSLSSPSNALNLLIRCNPHFRENASLDTLCTQVTTGIFANLSPLYLLTTNSKNIEILRSIIDNSRQIKSSNRIADALVSNYRPLLNHSFSAIYNLSRTAKGCDILYYLLTKFPAIIEHIPAQALCNKVSTYKDMQFSTLFWLCYYKKGRAILKLLLDKTPQLAQNVQHTSFYAINRHGSTQGLSPFFLLTSSADGRQLLLRLFTNSELAKHLTKGMLYFTWDIGKRRGSTPLFWLSTDKTGIDILWHLINTYSPAVKYHHSLNYIKNTEPYRGQSAHSLLTQTPEGIRAYKILWLQQQPSDASLEKLVQLEQRIITNLSTITLSLMLTPIAILYTTVLKRTPSFKPGFFQGQIDAMEHSNYQHMDTHTRLLMQDFTLLTGFICAVAFAAMSLIACIALPICNSLTDLDDDNPEPPCP